MKISAAIFPHVSQLFSRAQYAVLTKKLNVKKVYCVIGFSMGGQQVSKHCRARAQERAEMLTAYPRRTIGR